MKKKEFRCLHVFTECKISSIFKYLAILLHGFIHHFQCCVFLIPDEIEEELAPLIEAQETKKVETYEEQVSRTKDTAKELGWIHILGLKLVFIVILKAKRIQFLLCFILLHFKCIGYSFFSESKRLVGNSNVCTLN